MLNKYRFITIMEGEFCTIIVYKYVYQINLFLFMKENKNQ